MKKNLPKKQNKAKLLAISILILGIGIGEVGEYFDQQVRYSGFISNTIGAQRGGIIAGRVTAEELKQLEAPVPKALPTIVGKDQIQDYIRLKFGKHADEALAVAFCESSFNPKAIGKAKEFGLFQIHPIHRKRIERLGWRWEDMLDARKNTDLAWILFEEQGWRPWTCARIVGIIR